MKRSLFLKNIFGAGAGLAMSGELMAKIIAVADKKIQPEPIPDFKANTQLRIAEPPRLRDLINTEYGSVCVLTQVEITKGDTFWTARHISNSKYPVFHIRVTKDNHNCIRFGSAYAESGNQR